MKMYEKPIVLMNEELSEGVYAASGALSGSDCYSVTYNIHQEPQEGRVDYRIQFGATHEAADNHHSGEQILIVSFNQPVVFVSSSNNGTLVSGDGTATIRIQFNYHNNAYEYIGMGDVIVSSDAGLAVTGAVLQCNHDCGQH